MEVGHNIGYANLCMSGSQTELYGIKSYNNTGFKKKNIKKRIVCKLSTQLQVELRTCFETQFFYYLLLRK